MRNGRTDAILGVGLRGAGLKLMMLKGARQNETEGNPGISNYILKMPRVYHWGEVKLASLKRKKRRLLSVFDLTVFLEFYTQKGLL